MRCRGRTRGVFPLQRFAENLCQVSSGDVCTKSECVRCIDEEGLQICTEDMYVTSGMQDFWSIQHLLKVFS